MFGFLKKKLGEAIGKFSKKAEEEAKEEPPEQEVPAKSPKKAEKVKKPAEVPKKQQKTPPKKPEQKKKDPEKELPSKKAKPVKITEPEEELKEAGIGEELKENKSDAEPEEEPPAEAAVVEKTEEKKKGFFDKLFGKKEAPEAGKTPEKVETPEEPKGILGKISESITKVSISSEKFDELFWDIELAMLENNVAVEVIEKIKDDLKAAIVDKKISRSNIQEQILSALRDSIESLFSVEGVDIIEKARQKKPYIVALIGVNGSGKTTSVAKIVNMLQKNRLRVVIGACDTFRAAAIQQLEEHANNLGVKVIKHDYGADPAAVAFDTVEHAKAKGIDVVLLDTAGRLHSNSNLMDELRKIVRVAKPDLKIFVGESIAGNDLVEQVKLFNADIGLDGIILSKADVDEKGGAAISVTYITKKPILYIGTGQNYEDLIVFSKDKVMEQIGL